MCDPLWFGATQGGVGAASALAGGRLFVTGWDGRLSVFDPEGCGRFQCDPLWTGTRLGQLASTPAIAGGLVFVGYRDEGTGTTAGAVAAFPIEGCGARTCKPIWSMATGGASTSAPVISRGMLFVSGEDRLVHAFGLS
jgi:PQQ-like domain